MCGLWERYSQQKYNNNNNNNDNIIKINNNNSENNKNCDKGHVLSADNNHFSYKNQFTLLLGLESLPDIAHLSTPKLSLRYDTFQAYQNLVLPPSEPTILVLGGLYSFLMSQTFST